VYQFVSVISFVFILQLIFLSQPSSRPPSNLSVPHVQLINERNELVPVINLLHAISFALEICCFKEKLDSGFLCQIFRMFDFMLRSRP